jgi:serine/threonine protein kinase/tetratricopeptide (TPR) repeat protein
VSTQIDRSKEIFLDALEIRTSAERSAFLDRVCSGDAALRGEVEELLAYHSRIGSFLDAVSPGPAETFDQRRAVGAGAGAVIGPYRLLEQIGEGGFGVVFMAEQQQPVRRKVAVKIIKPGMDSRQVIARFEAERQALAMMDHVNIARVFDAGATESGQPYFVMELIQGIPITKYCDDNHLTPRERLELFVPVCQAIQHAHQKGIIHRDIKPSNVMITLYDGKPVPKVIDFGVAKATEQKLTERTLFTQYGAMVGTLEYMSPEQAEMSALGVDTRSDIYSLGVLLYELLTGSTPLTHKRMKEGVYAEILRLIREVEPPRPSTRLSDSGEALASISANRHMEPARLTKLVRGELDWIVMKALEKERSRRYETANGFAMDVQRYLADEPVQAVPPSAAYRLRKFARRNKAALVTAAVVVAALLMGTAVATWQAVVATKANQEAFAAAAAEKKAKDTAELREAETRAALDFVENMVFAAARPEGEEGGLGREATLRAAVEAALPFVEASFTKEPLIEARLRMTLGKSFADLGEARIAANQYQKARALYTQHRGPDHPDTLRSMVGLADSYAALGRLADALKLHEETLALMKAKLGPDHPDTLMSMMGLADTYAALGRLADALKLHEETLALMKARFGPDHPLTLMSVMGLADSYNALGGHQAAVRLYEETLARMKAKLGPDHPSTLAGMHHLANSYYALDRHQDALKLREETLALMKAKLGPDHPSTLAGMNRLASSYAALDRHQDALKLREETLAHKKAKLGPDHPSTLLSMHYLATSYEAFGRHQDALQLHKETLALRKAKLALDHPDTLASMHHVADSYAALGRYQDALKLHEETLALRNAKLGPDHAETLESMRGVAASLSKLDRGAEAVPLIDECLRRATGKVVHPRLIPTVVDLRLRHFEKAKDAAGCRATAEMWEALKRTDAESLYKAACYRAVAAAVLRAGNKSETATKDAAEADRAMAWLRQAVAAGFNDVESMKKDTDLDAVRSRDDFRKLLKELEAGKGKK